MAVDKGGKKLPEEAPQQPSSHFFFAIGFSFLLPLITFHNFSQEIPRKLWESSIAAIITFFFYQIGFPFLLLLFIVITFDIFDTF